MGETHHGRPLKQRDTVGFVVGLEYAKGLEEQMLKALNYCRSVGGREHQFTVYSILLSEPMMAKFTVTDARHSACLDISQLLNTHLSIRVNDGHYIGAKYAANF